MEMDHATPLGGADADTDAEAWTPSLLVLSSLWVASPELSLIISSGTVGGQNGLPGDENAESCIGEFGNVCGSN